MVAPVRTAGSDGGSATFISPSYWADLASPDRRWAGYCRSERESRVSSGSDMKGGGGSESTTAGRPMVRPGRGLRCGFYKCTLKYM
jgi:hypothetical protein